MTRIIQEYYSNISLVEQWDTPSKQSYSNTHMILTGSKIGEKHIILFDPSSSWLGMSTINVLSWASRDSTGDTSTPWKGEKEKFKGTDT